MTCALCKHVHVGARICGSSNGRADICLCKSKEGMKMLDVQAVGESSKSDGDGKVIVTLKVAVNGRADALALAAMNGRQVEVQRQSGELFDVGLVRGAAQKKRTKQDDDAIDGNAKIVGGRNLQKACGLLVKIRECDIQPDERQPRLKALVHAAAEQLRPKKGGDVEAVEITSEGEGVRLEPDRTIRIGKGLCRSCGHPKSKDKNPRRKQDGHGRKSGECYVVGCNCSQFVEPETKRGKDAAVAD